MPDGELTSKVIAAAIDVHRQLGPGLLESAYEACLAFELAQRKIPFQRQRELPIRYKGHLVDCAYRMDMVIDNQLLLELKSVETVEPIHHAQVLSYMKLSGLRIGCS